MKAMLIIDVPEEFNDEELSVHYKVVYYPDGHLKEVGIHGKQRLIPLPNTLTNLNLELWDSLEGSIVAPKGMFDEIYNSGYEDGQKDSLSNIEDLTEKAFKDGFEEGRKR